YLLVYRDMSASINSIEKARAVVDFIAWAISDEGQVFAEELSYVPLPDEVQELNMQTLASLTYNGQPVIQSGQGPTEAQGQSFSISATHDGTSYVVSGTGADARATAISITPQQHVTVQLEGNGEIELMLPKSMIEGINAVRAGNQEIEFETMSESSSSTTIRFTVPDGENSVNIHGATVVPEFKVVAVLVLAASIFGVVAYTRSRGSSIR